MYDFCGFYSFSTGVVEFNIFAKTEPWQESSFSENEVIDEEVLSLTHMCLPEVCRNRSRLWKELDILF